MTIPTPDEICERLRAYVVETRGAPNLPGGSYTKRIFHNPDGPEAADLIQQQQATIERLSAALEHLIDIIDGTEATGFDPHVEQMLMDAAETGRAALGKDASDVRAREEDRG